MLTIPFWVAFACALAASLVVSIRYGRHAIHPRLRPHFGQVLILFLLMALASFFLSLLIARMVGAPTAPPKPGSEAAVPAPAKVAPAAPVPSADSPAPVPPAEPPKP